MGMTREEFARIVKGLKVVYPYETFIGNQDAFDIWYALLKDLDYKAMSIGTTKLMQTYSKVPTPADIRKASIPEPDISEGEAWTVALKAIQRSSYYAQEEFDKLPEDVQRAVGSPDQLRVWAMTEDLNLEVIQSQFLRSYRQVKERSREMQLVDPKTAQLIQSTSKMMLEGA